MSVQEDIEKKGDTKTGRGFKPGRGVGRGERSTRREVKKGERQGGKARRRGTGDWMRIL